MQGFIHELFVEKWVRYARYWYFWRRTLDLIYFGLLVALSICMKDTSTQILSPHITLRLLPALLLSSALLLFTRDVRACYLYFDNLRSRPEYTRKDKANKGGPSHAGSSKV